MKAFKAPSCCCFDLETGGLILGYLGTLFWTLAFLSTVRHPISWEFAIIVILLATSISWVYGIHKNNHAFMLPQLIYDFISLVSSLIYLFVFSIAALIGLEAIASITPYNPYDFKTQREIDQFKNVYAILMFGLWFLLSILTALQWYFTSVKYSLYMKMKAAASGLDWFAGANCV